MKRIELNSYEHTPWLNGINYFENQFFIFTVSALPAQYIYSYMYYVFLLKGSAGLSGYLLKLELKYLEIKLFLVLAALPVA